jgi:hypothetical protein
MINPEMIDKLISDPEQPIQDIMRIVYGHGVRAIENAVFDEGLRMQHDDPDRAIACVRVIARIQLHTTPGLAEREGKNGID